MILQEFDRLEERIQAVTALVTDLRAQREALAGENESLREHVRDLKKSVEKQAAETTPRLRELESERESLIEERRILARRVEEMLAKLAVLEKAVHA